MTDRRVGHEQDSCSARTDVGRGWAGRFGAKCSVERDISRDLLTGDDECAAELCVDFTRMR